MEIIFRFLVDREILIRGVRFSDWNVELDIFEKKSFESNYTVTVLIVF